MMKSVLDLVTEFNEFVVDISDDIRFEVDQALDDISIPEDVYNAVTEALQHIREQM